MRSPKKSNDDFIIHLRDLVGARHVLTGKRATHRFCHGYRYGEGNVLAVVRPGSLLELWQVLQAVVAAGKIIIMQAANTGLTGGSTPDGDDYDRDIVLVSTLRLCGIQVISRGTQVVCLPGATLDALEKRLRPLRREPHSVIGSSCIGASVLGGICNNSGGALVRRGPAYTELSLYAQVDSYGQLQLCNHLGINLGDTPETILTRLERGEYSDVDIDACTHKAASCQDYPARVRDVDAATPARFNADPRGLYESSGSAGKLAVFAVRLDTFPMQESNVFYIGSNDPDSLTAIRRHFLAHSDELPIAAEYIHKDAFDIGKKWGKDIFLLIDHLGTDRIPKINSFKNRIDSFFERIGLANFADHLIQAITTLLPEHLPKRILEFRRQFDHHLLLRVSTTSTAHAKDFLQQHFLHADGDFFECSAKEGRKAFLHRFAVASAAIRYRNVHRRKVEDILALDIALRRNDREWLEQLPDWMQDKIIHKLYYGHFFCHVLHQDYIIKKGVDVIALEHAMLELLDARGAQYPAEHNVGHLYPARPALKQFYQALDPCNVFNPGIGKTSKRHNWI